jgi:YD repeat-containing protein
MKTTINTKLMQSRLTIGALLLLLLTWSEANSQPSGGIAATSIKSDLPTILPPSPTVASLMKFEEIAVNNYTGIPAISLPIYSFPTHSKDLTLDISLNYHPSSIAADEVASYVGLGWNLMAGGTISRTVKGLPDDMDESGANGRRGIYSNQNIYYDIFDINGSTMSPQQIADFNVFLWNAQIQGIRDTEHDLYQYNFMGNTGRFIIEKQNSMNYNIVKLDNDNNMQIEYDYSNKSFVIYDEKGIKYIFDNREITNIGSGTQTVAINGVSNSSVNNGYSYNSAFHLSKVYDSANILLVEFYMNTDDMLEIKHDGTGTSSRIMGDGREAAITVLLNDFIATQSDFIRIDPSEFNSFTTRATKTKKLVKIDVIDVGQIYFENSQGRQDGALNATAYRLNSIIIKDNSNTQIRKFNLIHSYSEILEKRMMLTELIESNGVISKKHKLSYNAPYDESFVYNKIGKDYWGFFNYRPDYFPAATHRETDPDYCKVDVLEKITFPTGGCVLFDFESNTYSHIGDEALTNFDGNPDNFTTTHIDLNFLTVGGVSTQNFEIQGAFINNGPVYVSFIPISAIDEPGNGPFGEFNSTDNPGQSGIFTLFKVEEGALIHPPIGGIGCGTIDGTCQTVGILLQPGNYAVRFNSFSSSPLSGSLKVLIRKAITEPKQYLYGGGVRIKQIGYFDIDASIDNLILLNTAENENTPAKLRKYDYCFFGQVSKSSGSLTFPKPLFSYTHTKDYHFTSLSFSGMPTYLEIPNVLHYKNTTFNNLLPSRTHGSDVGYQNVTVYEESNGKTEFVYKSPIDEPEEDYSIGYPFFPAKNKDYMRGLLISETTYNHQNPAQLLTKRTNEYNFVHGEKKTGMRIFMSLEGCRYLYKYNTGNFYHSNMVICGQNPLYSNLCSQNCGLASAFIGYGPLIEKFGWTQLKKSTSTAYFYKDDVQSSISKTEDYEYNAINKKIASQTVQSPDGNVYKTDYDYIFFNNNRNEVSQITSYVNGETLSSQKVLFATGIGNNASPLPEVIQSSKGMEALETRLRYSKYDTFGNVLEVQQENGTKICYIWGYKNTRPVAKIENMAYSDIPPNLLTAVQDAITETMLSNALLAFRNNSSLDSTMITTYTYKPLIGIATVTDPKGNTTKYSYDPLGRLSAVRDHDNNLLSTNTYNYRP